MEPSPPLVTVPISDVDDDGRGVGDADGLEVHVAGALPGERARVRIEHQSPHAPRAWGTLVALEGEPAPERVEPACPGHGRCGGCVLQHLAVPAQLTVKRRRIERELARYPSLAGTIVEDVVASPRERRYRNKAKYVLAPRAGGGLVFGSYAPGTHQVVDMAGCQVPEEPIDAVARAFVRLAEEEAIPAYDERQRTGELRHLVVRVNADGDVLVVVVARSGDPSAALVRVARRLMLAFPQVAGLVLHVQPAPGGAIFGRGEDVLLEGAPALADRIAGERLELSARSFFQVNRAQAERMYRDVVAAARAHRGTRAIDLYSGAGAIALLLGRRGARVVGVEVVEDAVADARRSAAAAGLGRTVSFVAADAAEGLPQAARRLGNVEVVVVNPPRKGLGAAPRAALLRLAPPRIVYVSCGPRSLADDLDVLVGAGYRIERLRPFDLMPGTPHVETVAVLDRGG